MYTKIHPKGGLLVDKGVHKKSPKIVHEKSPFDNVHEMSPILKKSVHEMSLSTKCLHPFEMVRTYFLQCYENHRNCLLERHNSAKLGPIFLTSYH